MSSSVLWSPQLAQPGLKWHKEGYKWWDQRRVDKVNNLDYALHEYGIDWLLAIIKRKVCERINGTLYKLFSTEQGISKAVWLIV